MLNNLLQAILLEILKSSPEAISIYRTSVRSNLVLTKASQTLFPGPLHSRSPVTNRQIRNVNEHKWNIMIMKDMIHFHLTQWDDMGRLALLFCKPSAATSRNAGKDLRIKARKLDNEN